MNKQNKEEKIQRARIRIYRKVKNLDILNLNKKINQTKPIINKNTIRRQKIEKGRKIAETHPKKNYTKEEREAKIKQGRNIFEEKRKKLSTY